jgi:hypothetical protein
MTKKLCILASILLTTSFSASSQTRHALRQTSDYTIGPSIQPLLVYGEGWSQRFTIINVDYYNGGEPTTGALRFYTSTGSPWRIPLRGRGQVSEIAVNLGSGQMISVETEVSDQAQQLGWAKLDLPDSNAWGIYHAFTTFRKQTSGAPDLMTTAPFVDDLERELVIPFDNTGGKYPGIGLVNAGTIRDTYVLDVYDLDGNRRKTIAKTVEPLSLQWFSLLGENPELANLAGQIKVSASRFRAAAFTLQFAPNGAFTALPVVHTFGMN